MRHSALLKSQDEAGCAMFCIRVLLERTSQIKESKHSKKAKQTHKQSYTDDGNNACDLLLPLEKSSIVKKNVISKFFRIIF